ncbi:MAG: glycoside hydrolase family 97 C-terminal domain-containing protein, partial [Thermodesulfobacteriota bacterium]
YPEAYKNQPGFEFIQQVPTVWDQTNVINAEVGNYITIARKYRDDWYLGSMTNWTARELNIPLNFLSDGNYLATMYSDAETTNTNPNELMKTEIPVSSKDTITINLATGGGNVIYIKPI